MELQLIQELPGQTAKMFVEPHFNVIANHHQNANATG
jgi:hypothetical protein